MPNHNTLTGDQLHEPKGVASADAGMMYVADGLGSGTWTQSPSGWGYYKDAGVAQVFTTTPTLLSIDAADVTTEESYLPRSIRGSGNLWNSTTNRITPVALGDAYSIRLDLPVTAETGSPTELKIELDIKDGSVYADRIRIVERLGSTGRSTPYTISVAFPIFVGSTFINNGGQIWITDDTGTVTVTNPGIVIVRAHGEVA